MRQVAPNSASTRRTTSAARTHSGSQTGNGKKQGSFWIAPTALPLDVTRGPVGTTFRIHLKGVGWSETANIYTVVYDNATSGYACAFNSQGDVEIFMQATGEPGWHFIDLYPAIYKGKETRPNNYRLPQLTYADDHPGRGPAAVPLRLRSYAAGGAITLRQRATPQCAFVISGAGP